MTGADHAMAFDGNTVATTMAKFETKQDGDTSKPSLHSQINKMINPEGLAVVKKPESLRTLKKRA